MGIETEANRADQVMLPSHTQVAIIGAGPVGLAAAIPLADAGIDFVLLDQQTEGQNTSRACVVHARTMEILNELGVSDELRDRGLLVPRFTIRDGERLLTTVLFDTLPTAHPYTLMVPQNVTEAVLLARLRTAGADVHRPYSVTGVRQDGAGADVDFTDAEGNSGTLRAAYVIGADGMHSRVREEIGVGFTGDTYPTSFVLADARMVWPLPRDEVSMHYSAEGITVVAPLPDDRGDRYRVMSTVEDAPENPTGADIESILNARGPKPGAVRVEEVLWSSRFRVHHRLADSFRSGRVFLAGDAAHVHSPAGGQGMNTGIQDAVCLGRLLVRVQQGEPEALLARYERERRPVAQGVVTLTDRMTRMATLRSPAARWARNLALRGADKLPQLRRALAYRLAELDRRPA